MAGTHSPNSHSEIYVVSIETVHALSIDITCVKYFAILFPVPDFYKLIAPLNSFSYSMNDLRKSGD